MSIRKEVTNMKKLIVSVMLLSLLVLPLTAGAAELTADDLGLGLGGTTAGEGAGEIGLGDQDIMTSINSIIRVILSFLGILAVIIILWGGFIWMTAMGDETKVDKAKTLIIAGIVGIVIILSAYAIAEFVISSGLEATSSTI